MLLAAMGTACGGGAGTTLAERRRPSVRGRTVAPPPNPSLAFAAPAVIDRGDDYAAIAGSLMLYGRWLEWHHLDPALVPRAYQRGSPPERVVSKDVHEMRRIGAHVVEVDGAPLELTVISVTPNVVSLRMTEHLAHREAVAADGSILARDRARTEQYLISIARAHGEAPWRVNVAERMHAKVEVQL
jgi:hypothetical protein